MRARLRSVTTWLRESERQQAVIRLIITGIVSAYLFLDCARGCATGTAALWVVLGYLLIGIGVLASFARWPRPSGVRRSVTLACDLAVTSLVAGLAGAVLAPFFAIYLWLILGYGIRYGQRFLLAATITGGVGFSLVLLLSPYWRDNPAPGIGMLLTLLIIPAFVSFLMRKSDAAKQEAERATLAKSRFLANMSHEIRTPLTGVIGMADILAATPLSAEQQEHLRAIDVCAGNLLRLLEDVLDISKIEAGKIVLVESDLDLHALVKSVILSLRAQAHGKGVGLLVHFGADVPFAVRGDPVRLRQILLNLVGNAVKFTDAGHVELCVRCRDADHGGPVNLRFEVRDTGMGISLDQRESIFEPFVQGNPSAVRRFGGTGLGTTIAKQLVERMGGAIGFASEPGHGTTFWFDIGLQAQPAARVAARLDGAPRALLVSSDAQLVAMLQGWLQAWGASGVVSADIGAGALALVDSNLRGASYDFVIVDTRPPAGAVEHLLRAPSLRDVPFIAIARAQMPNSGRVQGCMGIITPPWDRGQFFNAAHACTSVAQDAPASAFALMRQGKPLKILLAEDNEINQKVLVKGLQRAGHAVTLVSDGRSALDKLTEHRFDACILDIRMPEMDGLDVFKAYRFGRDLKGETPVIMLTANATSEVKASCEAAGVDAYLSKPVAPERLVSVLADLCAPRGACTAHSVPRSPVPCSFIEQPILDIEVVQSWLDMNGGALFLEVLCAHVRRALDDMRVAIETPAESADRTAIAELRRSAAALGAGRLRDAARAASRLGEWGLDALRGAAQARLYAMAHETLEEVEAMIMRREHEMARAHGMHGTPADGSVPRGAGGTGGHARLDAFFDDLQSIEQCIRQCLERGDERAARVALERLRCVAAGLDASRLAARCDAALALGPGALIAAPEAVLARLAPLGDLARAQVARVIPALQSPIPDQVDPE